MLKTLRASQVRNLDELALQLDTVNVIFGSNGSGKTSLLEAVSLLATARSFRSHRVESVIRHGAPSCTVYGEVAEPGQGKGSVPLGLTRERSGQMTAKVHGDRVQTSSRLAEQLPVLSINSTSFSLLEGGPKARRRFLDWGVFHVEPRFHATWLSVKRALKQRNSLLRRGKIRRSELLAWDQGLAEAGEELDRLRRNWFQEFQPCFDSTMSALRADFDLELAYHRGWDKSQSLNEALERHWESDQGRGFTGVGPHRADLKLRTHGSDAAELLSRGQQKLVVMALMIAQGRLLGAKSSRRGVYLVDDLPAELDAANRQLLCAALLELGAQILITCVDPQDLAQCWLGLDVEPALFHVEQGRVGRLN